MDWWNTFLSWFFGLGAKYHVDPIIFGIIYVAAIPFFFASLYWTVRNIRNKKSVAIPALLTGLFFISAYLYLIISGQNIPIWVYFFIGLMVIYGTYSTLKKIRDKTKLK